VACAVALLARPVHATWSIAIADRHTKEVAVGTVTCLNDFDLLAIVPVVVMGKGAAAVQAAGDFDGQRRPVIYSGFQSLTDPDDIFDQLAVIAGHQSRQYGIADTLGRTLTFTGADNSQWAGGVTGEIGSMAYAIQGNILAGACVVPAIEQAVRNTPGDIPARLMAGMLAAGSQGGDGRCSCSPVNPTLCGCPPASFDKPGHIGGMIVARIGDSDDGMCDENGCADGGYYMRLNVAFESNSDPDPVDQLQDLFNAWRAALDGRPDAIQSTADLDSPSLLADGVSTASLAIHLSDWQGLPPDVTIESVTVTHAPDSDGICSIGSVVDQGGGTYTVGVTAGLTTGLDRLRIVVDDGIRNVTLMPAVEICVGPATLPLLARDASGLDANRAAAFAVPTGATANSTAIRVTLSEMYVTDGPDPLANCPVRTGLPDLSQLSGEVRWLGPPAEFSEQTLPPMLNLIAAPLQCCPHIRDWSQSALASEFGGDADVSVLYAYGAEIVPCSSYDLEFVASGLTETSCAVRVPTGKWGDVVAPFRTVGQPNFLDINALVNKYKGIAYPAAPKKAYAKLSGNVLSFGQQINFEDIGSAVRAYKTIPYAEAGPAVGACSDPCP
jgi:uncharacterized Ntn-hydrolase superfamily protein